VDASGAALVTLAHGRYIELGALVLTVTVVVAAAVTPGYSHERDTVSRLGSPGQPLALVVSAGFIAYGVLVVIGLSAVRPRLVGVLGSIYGAAAIVAGLAPKDAAHSTHHTLASQIHVDATIVGGVAIIGAMVVVASSAPRTSDRQVAAVVAVLACIGAVAFRVTWGWPIYGMVERALLVLSTGWLIAISARRLDTRRISVTRTERFDAAVGVEGLEPTASSVSRKRSTRLS
jgi:hypothetical membrane protein